jgi:catechol 2,3-dioxygenase-like lactoylglutathione lyase family enzyme
MIEITAYEHVGIRVSDPERSLSFYRKLGFEIAHELPEQEAIELVNSHGMYINLIINAVPREKNILLDEPIKLPGITHVAFIVRNFDAVLVMFEREKIAITEGPLFIGERRRVCFIRDPDGTVLEFDELMA